MRVSFLFALQAVSLALTGTALCSGALGPPLLPLQHGQACLLFSLGHLTPAPEVGTDNQAFWSLFPLNTALFSYCFLPSKLTFSSPFEFFYVLKYICIISSAFLLEEGQSYLLVRLSCPKSHCSQVCFQSCLPNSVFCVPASLHKQPWAYA